MAAVPPFDTSSSSSDPMDDIQNLSESDLEQILGLNTNNRKYDRLQLQMQLANKLRTQSQPPQGQMAGQVYIPPNPFQTALSTYDHLKGIMQESNAQPQGDELDAQRQGALNKFMHLLFNGKGSALGTQQNVQQMAEDQQMPDPDASAPQQ